jgi:alpha/beta superfamily hydrolase
MNAAHPLSRQWQAKPSRPGRRPIECAVDEPRRRGATACAGVAVVLCHPHPQHGGTMDNKVVQTLARAFVQLGWRSVRFNFRGVGGSAGPGTRAAARSTTRWPWWPPSARPPGLPLALGGFSFGGYVATQAAARLPEAARPVSAWCWWPRRW